MLTLADNKLRTVIGGDGYHGTRPDGKIVIMVAGIGFQRFMGVVLNLEVAAAFLGRNAAFVVIHSLIGRDHVNCGSRAYDQKKNYCSYYFLFS